MPTPPTPVDLVSQRRLLGLAPGSPVQVDKLGRALEHRSWVRSVDRTDTGLTVSIKDGPIASLRIELGPPDPHGKSSLLAIDGTVRGRPTWQALLHDVVPGAPLGLDPAGHTVWSISPRVAVATTQDDHGVMRPVTIDAGSLDLSTRFSDLEATFNQALQAGQDQIIEQQMVDLTPFGSRIVLEHRALWQDRQAALCGAPLSTLVERSLDSRGLTQRRAGRDALRHTLAACMEDG
ncbi:MAG: hypothetical protein GXP62_17225, partial [Oligoflexia bacterium]|nr:hypothetical protein [Oligoflexia bacterium]